MAFVIDESYSMDENDPQKKRVAVTKNFIDTLPKNMGTYNYNGMYYKYRLLSVDGAAHYIFDVKPYDKFGNVSPKDGYNWNRSIDDNKKSYEKNNDAINARKLFIDKWRGVLE